MVYWYSRWWHPYVESSLLAGSISKESESCEALRVLSITRLVTQIVRQLRRHPLQRFALLHKVLHPTPDHSSLLFGQARLRLLAQPSLDRRERHVLPRLLLRPDLSMLPAYQDLDARGAGALSGRRRLVSRIRQFQCGL